MLLKVSRSAEDPSEMEVIQYIDRGLICTDIENPDIQGVWNDEQERQRKAGLDDTSIKNYIMLTCNEKPGDWDILAVYFPELHSEYVFQDVDGVAQWYFQPRAGFNPHKDLPAGLNIVRHKFFQRSLVPVRQSIFDSISALLKFGTEFLYCPDLLRDPTAIHYNLKIRLNANLFVPNSARIDPNAYTRHRICSNVKFRHVIDTLCGPSESRPPTQTGLRIISPLYTAEETPVPTGQQEQGEHQHMQPDIAAG